MKWTIAIKDGSYVEVKTSGVADKDGSFEMAKDISATMRGNKIINALIDQTRIESVSGEIIEVYERSHTIQEAGAVFGIKIAEVVRPEHREFFGFLETVCINRGIDFAIFHDREAALKWLLA